MVRFKVLVLLSLLFTTTIVQSSESDSEDEISIESSSTSSRKRKAEFIETSPDTESEEVREKRRKVVFFKDLSDEKKLKRTREWANDKVRDLENKIWIPTYSPLVGLGWSVCTGNPLPFALSCAVGAVGWFGGRFQNLRARDARYMRDQVYRAKTHKEACMAIQHWMDNAHGDST